LNPESYQDTQVYEALLERDDAATDPNYLLATNTHPNDRIFPYSLGAISL
jgi:hypothetical protein